MPAARKKAAPPNQQDVLAHALADSGPSADSSGLLAALMREWGGPANVARAMKQEYDEAPKGGQTRQRFFEMLQRLVIMNTQQGLSNAVDPAALSDQDLTSLATRLLGKVYDAAATAATTARSE